MIDIEAVRADTPGCSEVIHFNNAGSSLPTRQSLVAVTSYLEAEALTGGYEQAALRHDDIEAVYGSVAQLIGANASEIALVESATRGWDLAFYAFDFKAGDRILTSRSEYASNVLAFLHARDRHGVDIVPIDNDASGQLDVHALAEAVDERVKLIAVNHVPTQGGLVNPAAAIGAVAHKAGVPFLLDACQSVGQLRVDVNEIGCDMLSATGRKYIRGPRGTGLLYIRDSFMDRISPPMIDLESARWTSATTYELAPTARRFEDWEASYACRLGLGAAVDYALNLGIDNIETRVTSLAASLRSALRALDGVTVHDLGQRQCGIVTFAREGLTSPELAKAILDSGVNVSVTTRFSSQFDLGARGIDSLVRASVHCYNTEAEVDRLLQIVQAVRT